MENHESGVIFSQQPLDEFESKPAEPITVGNHNRFDSSLHAEFQKGTQPGAFEVESGSNVCEFADVVVGEHGGCSLLELCLLVCSMSELLFGGDTCISCNELFRAFDWFCSRKGFRDVDPSMSSHGDGCRQLSSFDPRAYCPVADPEVRCRLSSITQKLLPTWRVWIHRSSWLHIWVMMKTLYYFFLYQFVHVLENEDESRSSDLFISGNSSILLTSDTDIRTYMLFPDFRRIYPHWSDEHPLIAHRK